MDKEFAAPSKKEEWVVREYVNPESGEVTRRYTYKGKGCKRIEVKSKLAEQLSGYTLIEKDLRSCIVWLREIERVTKSSGELGLKNSIKAENREIFNLVKGLYVAMITFYGKCYASCEGRRVKLERNQLGERFRDLHDYCIRHRNNFTAHSGAEKIETCKIALVYQEKTAKDKPVPYKVYSELFQPDAAYVVKEKAVDGVHLESLFEHARELVNKKRKNLSVKIYEEDIFPKFKNLRPL